MGSEKDASSETSSDDQETGHSKDGFGRSYECNFCKRGFTNAQALGGHMNIHRKDKAKAKQHKSLTNKTSAVSVNSVKSFPNYKDHHHHHHHHSNIVSSNSFNLVTNDQEPRYLSSSFGIRSSDHVYDQFSSYDQLGYGQFSYNQFTLPNPNPAIHEENSRVNLNLGIGTSEMEDDDNTVEDDIDLELRLGH